MRLLIFQHIACEHPGHLHGILKDDAIVWDAVEDNTHKIQDSFRRADATNVR